MTEFTYTGENSRLRKSDLKTINGTSIVGSGDIVISGDINTIETIKVNGTALTPDANKAVDISSIPASILTGTIPNNVTATTQNQNDNSTKIATTAYVDTAIDNIPNPMIFKGSLGTGGTITTLPSAATSNEGYTYKVITNGTYGGQSAKVGDTFVSDGSNWIYIPSGDEPSGTVTNVKIQTTSPIAIDDSSAITTSGTRTISHNDSGVTAGTYKSVTVDAKGHVTGGTNPTTLAGYGITDAIDTSSTAQTKAGSIKASKFITSGGNSSQVVRGDGSLVDPKLLPQYEAYLEWGGKNFTGSYGPIDAAMVSELGAPRTMFAKAAGIAVEYSTDGGNTWVDYGATNEQKVALFSVGQSFYTGKNTSASGVSTNNMLRVSLYTSAASIYTSLNKFVIYVSTSGSSGCYCTIRCRTQQNYEDNVDTWITRAEQVPIQGWSGYNVINVPAITTYGNIKASHYGELQFIFGYTGISSTGYSGLTINRIFGFGGVGWTCPSNMAKTGHLYSFNASQDAIFPAQVQATSFKKTGGTSSQFLKADGSVDETSYGTYSKPSGGIPKTDLASAVQTSLGKADTALQSFTETDPTVPSHVKSITQQDITNWNNKLSSAPVTSVNGQTGAVVISDATTTTNGLMSSNDKIKLNELKNSVKVFNVTASSFEESNVAIDWGDIKFSTITNAIENYDVVKIIVNLPPADGFSQIISLYHNETVSVPELNAFGYCFTSIDAVFGFITTALVLAKDTENEESDNITAQLLKCNISNKQDAISDLNNIRNNAEEGSQAWNALSNYQELLVSGKNIKTINDESILQKGNISIYWDRDEKIRDKYENQYLTFEIVEPGTIEWQFNGGSNYARYKKQISYNINDQGWNTTDATNDLFTIGTFEVGDIIQFKGNASNYAQGSNLAYNHFSGTASFNIYGNILSLRYDTNELSSYNLTSIIVYGLFEHTNVINAKNLILPYITTTLCYNELFSHCQKLISAPELPAPIISGISCYSSMFSNCTNLEIGPKILARSIQTGVDNCNYSLSSMFSGCTKLKLIYCLLESVDVNNTTTFYDFTKNVASTGTFCADINAEWPTGTNGIPVGWQVCTPREFLENVLTKVNNIENNAVTSVNGMTGAVTIENQLSNDYSPSTLINEDLVLESGDTYEEAFGKLEKLINDNEEITAAALTNLDERIPVIDQELSETSENPVQNKVIMQAIVDNEYVVSTALNNINDRLENKQDTLVSGTNIKTINGTSILGSGNISIAGGSGTGGGGDENVIETIKVNGTALTPDTNKAVDITVPTTLDSISDGTTRKLSNYLPLSGGTMTGAITVAPGDGKGLLFSTTSNINVSGTTNTILGFYNGTYIIGHTAYPVNIRGNATRPQYNGNQLALYSDIPSALTESTVSGWGFTKNAGTVTGVKMNGTTNNPTSGVVDLGTVITEHQDISGKANKNGSFNEEFNVSALNIDADGEQINLWADYNSQEKEVTLDITESNGGCHLKYIFDESGDTKYIATTDDLPTKTSDLTNDSGFLTTHQSIKSLNTNNTSAQTASASETIAGSGTINLHKVAKTGTYSDLIGAKTKLSEFTNDSGYIANNTFYNTITLRSTTTTLNSEDIILQIGADKIELNPTGLTYNTKHFLLDDAVITTDIEGGVEAHWSNLNDSLLLSAAVIKAKLDELPTVNNATLTIQKNGTTVNTFTANASSNVTANIQVNELPTVSSSDNGKILQVVNGAWSLVTPVTVYTGTSTPNSSLGINGDLYVLTS